MCVDKSDSETGGSVTIVYLKATPETMMMMDSAFLMFLGQRGNEGGGGG